LPKEITRLTIVMAGLRGGRHWLAGGHSTDTDQESHRAFDFFDLKGVVETLLQRLHVTGADYQAAEHASFQPGRTAVLVVGDVQIGILGELHPVVRESFGLPDMRVAVADLDLGALLAQVPTTWLLEPISAYPAVLQDLAVVVDEHVPAAEVHRAIVGAGGFLLKEVRLFDVYRGHPVPPGKKSLAFALAFQAPDKTLRDATVAKQVQRIAGQLNRDLGAELRT
jgi:phenylalanyl-tRNA synthetase beta chain